jgi:hypothetical protein
MPAQPGCEQVKSTRRPPDLTNDGPDERLRERVRLERSVPALGQHGAEETPVLVRTEDRSGHVGALREARVEDGAVLHVVAVFRMRGRQGLIDRLFDSLRRMPDVRVRADLRSRGADDERVGIDDEAPRRAHEARVVLRSMDRDDDRPRLGGADGRRHVREPAVRQSDFLHPFRHQRFEERRFRLRRGGARGGRRDGKRVPIVVPLAGDAGAQDDKTRERHRGNDTVGHGLLSSCGAGRT